MKNWRTTLSGNIFGLLYLIVKYWKTGVITEADIMIAGGLGTIGFLAKDAGVSGTEK